MADYQCYPIWEPNTKEYNINPFSLPISLQLGNDLMKWAAQWDKTLNWDNPSNSGFNSTEEESFFISEGKRLCETLNNQLGNQFEVEFSYSPQFKE
ncbi:MAG: hypothetical protein IPP74_08495 [Alphaproteobacteria bacterium]|nr:hypothetical protein [Alphaproteobacteria bacterium]